MQSAACLRNSSGGFIGPKDDGTYVVELRTSDGEALAISIPRHVIRRFQERMPYGLFVPEMDANWDGHQSPVVHRRLVS